MLDDLKFRSMLKSDLDSIYSIESKVQKKPWNLSFFQDCLEQDRYLCVVAFNQSKIVGYGILFVLLDQAQLMNLAIMSNMQGKGFGGTLLAHLRYLAKNAKAVELFLEVRQSNKVAQNLYLSTGFVKIGQRKDYYPLAQGREDAMVLKLDL